MTRRNTAAALDEFVDEQLGYSSALFKFEIDGYDHLGNITVSTQIPEGGVTEMEVTGKYGAKYNKPLTWLVRQENKTVTLSIQETGKLATWPEIKDMLFTEGDGHIPFARLTLLDEQTLQPTNNTFTFMHVWFQMDQADMGVEDAQTPLKYPVTMHYAYVDEYHQ